MTPEQAILDHYRSHGLTTPQATALQAFGGDLWIAQDEKTVAEYMDDGATPSPDSPKIAVAKSLLQELHVLGFIEPGYDDWWWLKREYAEHPPLNPQAMTPERLQELLGPDWDKYHQANQYGWRTPVGTHDYVYCELTRHLKTASISCGVERSGQLIAVTKRMTGKPWQQWHEQLRRQHWHLAGSRTTATLGGIYNSITYAPTELLELVAVPITLSLADVANLAHKRIQWWKAEDDPPRGPNDYYPGSLRRNTEP